MTKVTDRSGFGLRFCWLRGTLPEHSQPKAEVFKKQFSVAYIKQVHVLKISNTAQWFRLFLFLKKTPSMCLRVWSSTGSCRGKPVPGCTAPPLRRGTGPPPRSWAAGSRRPQRGAGWHPGRLSGSASGCLGRPLKIAPRGCTQTCRRTAHRPPGSQSEAGEVITLTLLIAWADHLTCWITICLLSNRTVGVTANQSEPGFFPFSETLSTNVCSWGNGETVNL